jgi:hypothetical protein
MPPTGFAHPRVHLSDLLAFGADHNDLIRSADRLSLGHRSQPWDPFQ